MPFIICGKFLTLCLQHFQLLQLRKTLAVVALQQGFTLLDDPEFGCHRLVVGDAFRIAAFYDADEFLRQLQNHFLAHLVILDDVDLRGGGSDSDFVHLRLGEVFVSHLDDGLLSQTFALQVVAEGHLVVDVLQSEDGDHLEQLLGRYVVDDGTILDGSHL